MRILFLGTPAIAALVLTHIIRDPTIEIVGIVTQPDRPSGRGRAPQPPALKQQAIELGLTVPILQPETLRDPAIVAQLVALQPDIGIVMAYGEILRRNVLAIPPAGYLNIHPSLLPRWRGPAPIAGAILAGDTETGVTVIRLAARMDAGPILAQHRQALAADARAEPLLNELCSIGAELLLKVLPTYLRDEHTLIDQDENQATYTGLIRKTDGIIDWQLPAQQIERMTRAYDPWPGATSTWQGQPIRVIHCNVGAALTDMQPGMLAVRDGNLWVACGSEALELLSIQPAGKRPMSAADWLRGMRDIQGSRLGNPAIFQH